MKLDNELKVVCIIQARMGSSRLPGKVLKEICGRPMLDWVVTRASRARLLDKTLVATTVSAADNPLAELCEERGVDCFRGSEFDVLDRYYQAARAAKADIVVRLTADCPLIDAGLIDAVIQALINQEADFAANRLPPPHHRTYPIGLDVEAARFSALELAWRRADQPYEREHVMPFLYDPAHGFKVVVMDHEADRGACRWTVDTAEDLRFVRRVVEHFGCRDDFSWLDVLELIGNAPEIASINAGVEHKALKDVDDRAQLK